MKQQKSWSPKSVLSPSPISEYSIEPEISSQLQINMFLPLTQRHREVGLQLLLSSVIRLGTVVPPRLLYKEIESTVQEERLNQIIGFR